MYLPLYLFSIKSLSNRFLTLPSYFPAKLAWATETLCVADRHVEYGTSVVKPVCRVWCPRVPFAICTKYARVCTLTFTARSSNGLAHMATHVYILIRSLG